MNIELPRILSPNLGCPVILSMEELEKNGFDVIIGIKHEDVETELALLACPSYPNDGKEFSLRLEPGEELKEGTLPSRFERVEETRLLISNTLRYMIFGAKVRFFRYHARLSIPASDDMLRMANNEFRPTLYDLILTYNNQGAYHALCLRPANGAQGDNGLRFIHLTDIHLSLRNDLYATCLYDDVSYHNHKQADYNTRQFNNFNENLRRFIRYANEQADQGRLDFVLMLGDLIDFLYHGFSEKIDSDNNNFQIFRNLILGKGNEACRTVPNIGLKVPIFTSTGNHDWRYFPYDPSLKSEVYGLDKEIAQQLDLYWADEQEDITEKIESFYAGLIQEGSPVSNKTFLGFLINKILRFLNTWEVKISAPLISSLLAGFISKNLGYQNPFLIGISP